MLKSNNTMSRYRLYLFIFLFYRVKCACNESKDLSANPFYGFIGENFTIDCDISQICTHVLWRVPIWGYIAEDNCTEDGNFCHMKEDGKNVLHVWEKSLKAVGYFACFCQNSTLDLLLEKCLYLCTNCSTKTNVTIGTTSKMYSIRNVETVHLISLLEGDSVTVRCHPQDAVLETNCTDINDTLQIHFTAMAFHNDCHFSCMLPLLNCPVTKFILNVTATFCSTPNLSNDNVKINPAQTVYTQGQEVHYSCDGDYALSVRRPSSAKCLTGTWDPPDDPQCEAFSVLLTKLKVNKNITSSEMKRTAKIVERAAGDDQFIADEPGRVEQIIELLKAIANAGDESVDVTDSVSKAVNNLMNLEKGIIYNTAASGRLIASLEQQISNFQDKGEGNYSRVFTNIAVTAVKLVMANIGTSMNFGNVFPDDEVPTIDGALDEDNVKLFANSDDIPINTTATTISVPISVLSMLTNLSQDKQVPVSFFIYDNANLISSSKHSYDSKSREVIVSQIIAARIETSDSSTVENLPRESWITSKFLTNMTVATSEEIIQDAECVSWTYDEDRQEGNWSNKSCTTLPDENLLTVCSCSRLASFAVLVLVDTIQPEEGLYWITVVGSIMSIICLVLSIVTFLSLENLRSKQATLIHINVSLSLIGFYTSFLLTEVALRNITSCVVVSAIIHYTGLATMLWMSIEAIHIYSTFGKDRRSNVKRPVRVACLIGYGVPILPVVLVACLDRTIIDQEAYYCFIHPGPSLYYGFLSIIGVLFVFNFAIFIWVTQKVLCRPVLASDTQQNARRKEIIRRISHGVLFWFILGSSWIFGFLSNTDLVFQYIFSILFALQGVMIFTFLCVANPEFRKCVRNRKYTKHTITTNSGQGTNDFKLNH